MNEDLMKLKSDCDLYKSKIDRLEHITEKQEERIQTLEKNNAKTDFQFEQIMKTLDKLNNVTIPQLTAEIQAIKDKPAERYNTIVVAVITSVVGGIIGFLASNILN